MKLSEAILLGIGLVKNDRGTFGYIDSSGQCQGCAITTALVAIGKFDQNIHEGSAGLHRFWPWTACNSKEFMNCPISMEISHRHYMGESRESIASWVATIEPTDIPIEQPIVE